MASNAKKQLVDLLDRKVFRPILNKRPEDFSSDRDREKFEDVRQSTEAEVERFRNYPSAEKVRDMYLSDLSAKGAAERVQRYSKDLGLPTLHDVRDEFESLCERLGVGPKGRS